MVVLNESRTSGCGFGYREEDGALTEGEKCGWLGEVHFEEVGIMQDKVLDAIESHLGLSPQPDQDGAQVRMRDSEGNLVETRPKHHVDPLGKTEAVTPAAPQKRPKTLLERLDDLMTFRSLDPINLRTKSGESFDGVCIVEVTEELVVLHPAPDCESSVESAAVVLVDSIESWSY